MSIAQLFLPAARGKFLNLTFCINQSMVVISRSVDAGESIVH